MKRKIVVFTILATFCAMNILAQNANRQRLDAYKIAFFTKRLNLTPTEAEKFWPVYNEYQDNKNKIQIERQELNRNFNQNELNMSEKEMIDSGDKLVGLEVREAALAQEFHHKIKTVLSPVKVLRLYQAENQYRLQLLKELQERREVRVNQNIRQQ
ncbi:MAG TPA: hypothetical protein DEO60_01465 [Bacteroidales bacterium]|jgi:hypothetical protein|nr:hypothetical protein [Bacteroidales bacterium]HBZ19770.1 hypothetical protein [Bacteroidales bacterium]